MKTIGSRVLVWRGKADHTNGGLKKTDIIQKRVGMRKGKPGKPMKPVYRYISAKKSNNFKSNSWAMAVKQARSNLGITGFALVRGELYDTAKIIHDDMTKVVKTPVVVTKRTKRRVNQSSKGKRKGRQRMV